MTINNLKFILASLLFISVFIACSDDDSDDQKDCTIEGRWIISGLNESTLYEFDNGLRYSIYSTTSGEFGTIEDAIPNPNEYSFEGDSLIIDLNFGNFSRTLPIYKCDCNVVELTNESGVSLLYKEGYNIEDCR